MSLPTTRRLPLYVAVGTAIAFATLAGAQPRARAACTPAAVMSPQGDGAGAAPSLSADGRFMAFQSSADDLVPGDSDFTDIFVFDRVTCAIERVSVSSAEDAANSASANPAISDDGRFVVFESSATNLAPDSNGFTTDIFLRDRQFGTTSLVSVGFDGAQGASASTDAEISGDGSIVVFISASTTLVPADTNNEADVFVRDLVAATTDRASISTSGTQGDSPFVTGVSDPVLSADGRYVAFASLMNTLVANDFNDSSDIFVRDRLAGTTVRASVTSAGIEADGASSSPSISGDGAVVAFGSPASSDLVPGDGTCDGIYVRDLGLGTTSCLPLRPAGGSAGSNANSPAISGDGRFVVFLSLAAYVPGDSGFSDDVYVHDRQTGITRRATVNGLGLPSNSTFVGGQPAISADGQFVAFESNASNLVPSDTNDQSDAFVAAWPVLPDPPYVNTVRNGTFTNALQDWQTFATPDPSFIVTQFTGGVLEFFRQPPPPGTTNQAVVFQNTRARFMAHSAIEARMDLGNSSGVRKRMTVLLHEADFSDLTVCTFWLPPNAPLRAYVMRSHTTQFWTNASISFFAATAGSDGGFYRVDNVELSAVPEQDDDRTDCVDPLAPTPPGGAAGPELLGNGSFDSATLFPWTTFGQIVAQIAGGVFEFYRPAGTPAGVVLQQTGTSIAANQILTAHLYLGNSSSVRKRVTVLLHDASFNDLSACTFWLPPGLPLAPYRMRTYVTSAWTNTAVSIYPATVGADPWIRLDNVSLQVTPAASTDGTNCLEPGADILRALQSTTALARSGPPRAVSSRVAPTSPAAAGSHSAGGVTNGKLTLWQDVLDLTQAPGARLLFASQLRASRSRASVEVSLDGVNWQTLAAVPSSDDWQSLDVDLGSLAGQIAHVRIVFDAGSADDALSVRDVSVVVGTPHGAPGL
jgi:Tol biopolymer transport system component